MKPEIHPNQEFQLTWMISWVFLSCFLCEATTRSRWTRERFCKTIGIRTGMPRERFDNTICKRFVGFVNNRTWKRMLNRLVVSIVVMQAVKWWIWAIESDENISRIFSPKPFAVRWDSSISLILNHSWALLRQTNVRVKDSVTWVR